MDYAITVRTAASFAEASAQIRDALKAQGFGVLTEIDVQSTLREKLGEQMRLSHNSGIWGGTPMPRPRHAVPRAAPADCSSPRGLRRAMNGNAQDI